MERRIRRPYADALQRPLLLGRLRRALAPTFTGSESPLDVSRERLVTRARHIRR